MYIVNVHVLLLECRWFSQAIGADEGSGDSDEGGGYEDTPKKRGKGKKKRRGGDDDEDDDEPRRKRKKVKRGILKKMKKLIEVVNQYQDADGRVLSEPFYQVTT